MENQWVRMNQRKIEAIQHTLTEIAYKNENPGVPVGEVRGIIGAAIVEIKKLQKEVDTLKEALKQATTTDTPQPDSN